MVTTVKDVPNDAIKTVPGRQTTVTMSMVLVTWAVIQAFRVIGVQKAGLKGES